MSLYVEMERAHIYLEYLEFGSELDLLQFNMKYTIFPLVPLLCTPNKEWPKTAVSMTFNAFDVTLDCIYSCHKFAYIRAPCEYLHQSTMLSGNDSSNSETKPGNLQYCVEVHTYLQEILLRHSRSITARCQMDRQTKQNGCLK